MPCCWPPTAIAATSSSSPPRRRRLAAPPTRPSGSTSVPSGWGADPLRTSSPVSASQTTTLQDWVEESIPATYGMRGF